MYAVWSIIAIFAAIVVLLAALFHLLQNLLDRGQHDASLIADRGLEWPQRYRGMGKQPPAEGTAALQAGRGSTSQFARLS